MPHLNKVIAWERQDGGVSITHLHSNDMLPGESEDDFITRYSNRLKLDPLFGNSVMSVVLRTDVPNKDENRYAWSVKNGKVEVDTVKVQQREDLKNQKKAESDALISKLGIEKADLKVLKEALKEGA